MDLPPVISHEWRQDHTLSRTSLRWLEEHADPGDAHPIATALAALRALELAHE